MRTNKEKEAYLPLYYKWIEEGKLPDWGLCCSLPSTLRGKLYKLFNPCGDEDNYDLELLVEENKNTLYWGSNMMAGDDISAASHEKLYYDFTELRQNILLLLAAINGEL